MVNSAQFLRIFAAFAVVLFHGRLLFDNSQRDIADYWLRGGYVGVDIFFLISGFVMYLTTTENSRPLSFLLKRLIRIVPMYYLCSFVFFVAGGGAQPMGELITSLLFCPPAGQHRPPFLGYATLYVGWTLNYEMWFYLVFALSLFCRKNRYPALLILLIVPILAVQTATGHYGLNPAKAATSPIPYLALISNPLLLEFPAGILLGFIYKTSFQLPAAPAKGLLSVAIGFFLYRYIGNHFHGHGLLRAGLPAFILFLSLIIYEKSRPIKLPPLLAKLADASYSLYLIHPILVKQIAPQLKPVMSDMTLFILYLVASLFLAFIVHTMIEAPITEKLRRKLLRRPAAEPAASRLPLA